MTLTVRRLGVGDEATVLAAAHLFDDPPVLQAVADLLASPSDHLLLAFIDGQPAGFALAHELRRTDGLSRELFLYEIGTDEAFRRRGVARSLIDALTTLGRARNAHLMFVLTHDSTPAAVALYAATGGTREGEDVVLFDYKLD
ncbi:GNAT family N-acetyltransferase [Deinococcus sp. Arct2-2]|uniref:GNAT family N-acetyltransferase n=1 Tax=Deinococcus sp. Arct2-2 TaxID=2568653 RepID=UPI0010A44276|nr:GNAT family N-acetyltransferase [Deinococcus sp. Arct2-2]THF71715.1 GNAT family N-acetyltransferase [Deinococcus sp. Arct2-2]